MNITDITPRKEQKTERIKLAPYCRVSSSSEDQLHSFAAQILYYSEYVKRRPEYELVDLYADEGITGTELKKRDELNRLLYDCHKGKIDRIITKSVSRFARNTEDLLVLLRMLKELGVSVYFEEQDIDTDKLNMEMIVTFPGMAAQQESEVISGNLRWSFQKRMESGEYNHTRPPYGYRLVNGQLEINPPEAKVICRIFNLSLQGNSSKTIADILNNENVPRRNPLTKWGRSTIKYLLTNERYKGDAVMRKHYSTDAFPHQIKKNRGEVFQYYVENSNTPIISREVFDTVQEIIKLRRNESCNHVIHPLTHVLRCSQCGGPFRRQVIANKAYWLCMRTATGELHCKSRRVREESVYEAFIDMVYKLKINRERLLGPCIRQLELLQARTQQENKALIRIDKELADLNAKNLIITRLHTSGILSASKFSAQSAEINDKILKLRIERRNNLSENGDHGLLEIKELDELIENIYPDSRFNEELFERIVKQITVVDNSRVTFHLLGGLMLTKQIDEKGRCKTR